MLDNRRSQEVTKGNSRSLKIFVRIYSALNLKSKYSVVM